MSRMELFWEDNILLKWAYKLVFPINKLTTDVHL